MFDGLAWGAARMPKTCTELHPHPLTNGTSLLLRPHHKINVPGDNFDGTAHTRTDNAGNPHVSRGEPPLRQNVMLLPLKGKSEAVPIGQKKIALGAIFGAEPK